MENTISKEETASSKELHGYDAWEPDWIRKRFIAILTCANPSCQDTVVACGDITTDWFNYYSPTGETEMEVTEYYSPRFFEPAPPVFLIPPECPEEVGDELKKAFPLVWSDPGASGNRLRVAVEALLNERKIPKRAKTKKGGNKVKYRVLSLHERIETFAEKHKDAGAQLMAIKWLGNTGSHAALVVLNRDDLLNAFEHFEYALDLVYVRKDVALDKRARDINRKKGPVRARKKVGGGKRKT